MMRTCTCALIGLWFAAAASAREAEPVQAQLRSATASLSRIRRQLESAFSRSRDAGDTWEQTSLIDTIITISDIAPGSDSKSLFLATYSAFGLEGIWRTAGEPLGNFWGRILSLDTTPNRLILRLSPNYITDYTIYAIEVRFDKNTIIQRKCDQMVGKKSYCNPRY